VGIFQDKNPVPVVPFDEGGNPLTGRPAPSTAGAGSSVNSSTNAVTLLLANPARLGATVYNESTAVLYLKLGAGAAVGSYTTQVQAGAYYEVPGNYCGVITGVWASANGVARVTELT
jgi:hypothetical protein